MRILTGEELLATCPEPAGRSEREGIQVEICLSRPWMRRRHIGQRPAGGYPEEDG